MHGDPVVYGITTEHMCEQGTWATFEPGADMRRLQIDWPSVDAPFDWVTLKFV